MATRVTIPSSPVGWRIISNDKWEPAPRTMKENIRFSELKALRTKAN
jgi:hypothetical protein